MTGATGFSRWNMDCGLAGGNHSIVTAFTGAKHLIVINLGRIPCDARALLMAGLAHVCCVEVILTFTVSDGAIVATNTATDDLPMIDCKRGLPDICGMALFASVRGVYVVDILSLSYIVIVT